MPGHRTWTSSRRTRERVLSPRLRCVHPVRWRSRFNRESGWARRALGGRKKEPHPRWMRPGRDGGDVCASCAVRRASWGRSTERVLATGLRPLNAPAATSVRLSLTWLPAGPRTTDPVRCSGRLEQDQQREGDQCEDCRDTLPEKLWVAFDQRRVALAQKISARVAQIVDEFIDILVAPSRVGM